jgi:Replication-relaxation
LTNDSLDVDAVRWLVKLFVLVVRLLAREQTGGVPLLDGAGMHAQLGGAPADRTGSLDLDHALSPPCVHDLPAAEMHFDNANTAQHRLTTLYRLRLVDRFQPLDHRYASLLYHYVLDQLGAMVIAAERGEDPDKSSWRADEALAIGKSQRLRHLVGVNGFFSALVAESLRREDCDLSLWWSERHCANQFERIAQPDGLGMWEEDGNRIVFCLEYDRSTETLERLEKKLKGYEDLQVASGLAYWICFCFRHPRREAGARRVLAQATVPVATAALGPAQRPHEATWAPIGCEGPGLHLAELARVAIPPESERRVAETQAYRRRSEALTVGEPH